MKYILYQDTVPLFCNHVEKATEQDSMMIIFISFDILVKVHTKKIETNMCSWFTGLASLADPALWNFGHVLMFLRENDFGSVVVFC